MVDLNEQIKRVVALAFKVNLMALNAIILARRAGVAARGFGVLSDELRRFSRELEGAMTGLRQLTWDAVSAVTLRLKHGHVTRVLQLCALGGGRAAALAADRIGHRADAAAEEDRRLRRIRRTLAAAIADADRIGLMGGVLARTARIEAAYGQGFREQFAGVAAEFDEAIQSILSSLDHLKKQNIAASA